RSLVSGRLIFARRPSSSKSLHASGKDCGPAIPTRNRSMDWVRRSNIVPIGAVVLAIIVLWYAFAIVLNAPWQQSVYARGEIVDVPLWQYLTDLYSQQ